MEQASYTRPAANQIQRQFYRLPNPDLVLYVFPHLPGTDPVPVPGYSTVFPLYQQEQYATPGVRVGAHYWPVAFLGVSLLALRLGLTTPPRPMICRSISDGN